VGGEVQDDRGEGIVEGAGDHVGSPERVSGVVAGIFDDMTGRVQSTIGVMAVTGRLTVNGLAGVPPRRAAGVPSRLARREGRKLFIEAEAHHDGERLATAEALWAQVPSERFGLPAGMRAG
jgi:hypothetical protein